MATWPFNSNGITLSYSPKGRKSVRGLDTTRKMWPANLIVKTILFSIRWQRRGLKFLIREPLELYFDGILNMYNAGNLKKSMSLCSLDRYRYLFYEYSHLYTCTFFIHIQPHIHIPILRAESFAYKCIVNT